MTMSLTPLLGGIAAVLGMAAWAWLRLLALLAVAGRQLRGLPAAGAELPAQLGRRGLGGLHLARQLGRAGLRAASSPRIPAMRFSSFSDPRAALSRAAEARSSARILIDALNSAMAASRSCYAFPVHRFVTWGNAFWLAWGFWTFKSLFGLRPLPDAASVASDFFGCAIIGFFMAAMTLFIAACAIGIWIEFLPNELD